MKKPLHLSILPASFALLAACCSHSVPDEAGPFVEALGSCESMEVFSIDPGSGHDAPVEAPDRLRGARVLGRAKVDAAADRAEIARLITEGIAQSDGALAACFEPRHGFRVEAGGQAHEFVVCYECLTVRAWAPGSSEGVTIPTANEVEPALTALFARLGLKIEGSH